MSARAKALQGGCRCGAVRYKLTSPPLFTHCCHCRNCQRQSGGAFLINAVIEADRIAITKGAPTPVHIPAESERKHDLFRCDACHGPLWSRYGARAPLRYLRVVTLDDPDALTPGAHIFIRSKAAWLTLADDIPALRADYDRAKLWPPESLARLKAAKAS